MAVCMCVCVQIKAPVLLMLGGRDRRVSPHQGLELYKALKSRASPVRYTVTSSYGYCYFVHFVFVIIHLVALCVTPDSCGSQKTDTHCPGWTHRSTASSTQCYGCSNISKHIHMHTTITHLTFSAVDKSSNNNFFFTKLRNKRMMLQYYNVINVTVLQY